MNIIIDMLSEYTFQVVAIGACLIGIISGSVGSIAVIRKQSLIGDGISHCALPGVVLAFLISGSKNTEVLIVGALITGLLSTFLILNIVKNSKIKFDSALAMILAVFFGLGLVLLTHSQKIPNANQAGLDRFIYGQAASLMLDDLIFMIISTAVLLVFIIVFWKEVKLVSFDCEYAQTLGFKTKILNFLISFSLVVTIVIGLQTVGAILMSSMIIAPAIAARQWTDKLSKMIILSSIIGGVCGVVGTIISSLSTSLPTGPVIVVCTTVVTLISLLIAPNRGIIFKIYQNHQNKLNLYKKGG